LTNFDFQGHARAAVLYCGPATLEGTNRSIAKAQQRLQQKKRLKKKTIWKTTWKRKR
jgi:hypothetical protein